ncbi:MAG: TA system VapC family ribonuclease toxin [Terracidiphilus sp.]
MTKRSYLPDVNILIALTDPEHSGHSSAIAWHRQIGDARLLLCPFTEAGFVRLTTMPAVGGRQMSEALTRLRMIAALPNCENLPLVDSWISLIQPLTPRLHGYRQVTDALLLGLAIRSGAILVTLDRAIQALAGEAYAANLLTLA